SSSDWRCQPQPAHWSRTGSPDSARTRRWLEQATGARAARGRNRVFDFEAGAMEKWDNWFGTYQSNRQDGGSVQSGTPHRRPAVTGIENRVNPERGPVLPRAVQNWRGPCRPPPNILPQPY